MGEADLQKRVQKECDRRGYWWFHVTNSKGSRRGFPDLMIIGRAGILYRELKDDWSEPTSDQRLVGYRIQAARGDWAVWQPRDWDSGRITEELDAIT